MAAFTSEDIILAQKAEKDHGVPASVTLAQYALESGWGKSTLATTANNYFGIKGKNPNTGSYVVRNGSTRRSYSSKAESFDDHGKLLSKPLYTSKTSGAKNVYEYVDVMAETYAPSSDGNNGYAQQLKTIINQYNLTQYDGNTIHTGFEGKDIQMGTGVWNPNSTVGSTGTGAAVGNIVQTGLSDFDISEIVGKIIKFIVLILVGVLAAVFFFSAFDITPKSIVKKAVKKKAGKVTEVVGEVVDSGGAADE